MSTHKSLRLPWLSTIKPDQGAVAHGRAEPSLIHESTFVQMLRFERRRTERSGRQFILVLLCTEDSSSRFSAHLAKTIAGAISAKTRETDILGWYEQDQTMGLLMTEIGQADATTTERIVQKISGAVRNEVDPESFRRLTMSFHIFPQEIDQGTKHRGRFTFFPDLAKRHTPKRQSQILKRVIDVSISLSAIVLFLPLIVMISILVKLTSPGPVLFRQKRVGQYGREFSFLKFRTMSANNDATLHREYIAKLISGTCDASPEGKPFFKLTNDRRITPIGKLLRRTSLDELPQFLNILRADMSLVGPRPPLPYEYERYQVWHKRRVHELKPGLTGLWQVEGRSRTNFNDMVRMDLRYATRRSFWVDCKIILQTPGAMISGRGAC